MSHSVWRVESVILSYMVRHVLRAPVSMALPENGGYPLSFTTQTFLQTLTTEFWIRKSITSQMWVPFTNSFHYPWLRAESIVTLWAEEGLTVSCYVSQLQRSRPRPIITSDGRQRLQPVPAEILILDNVEKSWWWGADVWGTAPWGPLPLSSAPDCNRSVRCGHGRQ